MLPFAEDVREFQFPSFSNFPVSLQPNEQQQEAADNLVKMLELAPTDREEILRPDFTPNPVLEVLLCVFDKKNRSWKMIWKPIDFYEKLEKETGDLVRCSQSFPFFPWKFFLTHPPKQLDSPKSLILCPTSHKN